jgi:metallophosphoesterase (TIGR00282 family)
LGRTFMRPLDDPFRAADALVKRAQERGARYLLIDMHAEATSEKMAMGWHLDGRASAVLGTHTHVPTADARVLPGGTAYLTDTGMTGPYDSVIGMQKEAVLANFKTGLYHRFQPASGDLRFCSVLVTLDDETGKARSIERVDRRFDKGDAA